MYAFAAGEFWDEEQAYLHEKLVKLKGEHEATRILKEDVWEVNTKQGNHPFEIYCKPEILATIKQAVQ